MPKSRPHSLKLPPTPEIKRVLAAIRSVGIWIAAIEVEERCIRVFTTECVDSQEDGLGAFEAWKQDQESNRC